MEGSTGSTPQGPGPQTGGSASAGSGPGTGPVNTPLAPTHAVDPQERIDGLRAWIAVLERKLGIRTYVGVASAVLGIAAAIVAIVLAMQTGNDSATKAELERVEDRITASERQAGENFQQDLQTVTERLDEIDSKLSDISATTTTSKREIAVLQDDVQDLGERVSDLESGGGRN